MSSDNESEIMNIASDNEKNDDEENAILAALSPQSEAGYAMDIMNDDGNDDLKEVGGENTATNTIITPPATLVGINNTYENSLETQYQLLYLRH